MIPSYAAGILMQGNCPALVRGGVFSAENENRFVWDRSGLMDVRHAVISEEKRCGCSRARAVLMVSVLILSAASEAADWLIPAEFLDLSPENVWFDPSERKVRFCLAENTGTHFDSIFDLLLRLSALEAPETHAYLSKLKEKAETEHSHLETIKKELSLRLTGPG